MVSKRHIMWLSETTGRGRCWYRETASYLRIRLSSYIHHHPIFSPLVRCFLSRESGGRKLATTDILKIFFGIYPGTLENSVLKKVDFSCFSTHAFRYVRGESEQALRSRRAASRNLSVSMHVGIARSAKAKPLTTCIERHSPLGSEDSSIRLTPLPFW